MYTQLVAEVRDYIPVPMEEHSISVCNVDVMEYWRRASAAPVCKR